MANQIDIPSGANIKVVGVGGGGSNAVSRMYRERMQSVEYLVINTDTQALLGCDVPLRISIGDQLTQGKGVGGNPEKGAQAANESREQLFESLNGVDMVFVAAGMGGGTGTGAAPAIAEIAKQTGALTVGVVTTPFLFEGTRRMKNAIEGIEKLKANVDTLLIIPNERLSIICDEEITAQNAFDMADDVLKLGVQSITELVTLPGEINLDFADIKAIMENSGPVWMSIGYGSGGNRAKEAAHQAINNPLLDISVEEATGVLFNVTGGNDLLLSELNEAAEVIQNVVHPDANIIFGMATDEKMNTQVKLTVIATGMPSNQQSTTPNSSILDDPDIPPFMRRINKYRSEKPSTTLKNQTDVA